MIVILLRENHGESQQEKTSRNIFFCERRCNDEIDVLTNSTRK
jgi:hypothetical protein